MLKKNQSTQSTTHACPCTHRRIERSIKIKKIFKCSLFLKPPHKHSFVWRATRFQTFTERIPVTYAFNISTCRVKTDRKHCDASGHLSELVLSWCPMWGSSGLLSTSVHPVPPPKAAGFSLHPVKGRFTCIWTCVVVSVKSTKNKNLFVYSGSSKSDTWPGCPPRCPSLHHHSIPLKMCQIHYKNTDFSVKTPFLQKQFTFRGHSVQRYKANAHSDHHQGALNRFVVVSCGLHPFSEVLLLCQKHKDCFAFN